MSHRRPPQQRFESYLHRRDGAKPGEQGFSFKLRAEVDRIDEDLNRPTGERSPNAWATSLSISAAILNTFSARREREGQEGVDKLTQFLRISPDRVLRNMTHLGMKIRASVANYRQRGIDPQVEITVNPQIKRAKEAVLRWRGVEVPNEKSAEAGNPGAARER